VLAELARRVLRANIPDLSMALAGRFNDHQALMCKLHLRHIDELTELIDASSRQTPLQRAQGIAPDSKIVYVDSDHCKSGCAHPADTHMTVT
jgi:hypothetical protein